MSSLDLELARYFRKGAESINKLNAYLQDRKDVLSGISGIWKNPEAAKSQIDTIAIDLARKSLDEITDNHVALIELLNQEISAWSSLKTAIAEQNKDAINGFVTLLKKHLQRESRLMPPTAQAQALFVKMNPEQMKRAAKA